MIWNNWKKYSSQLRTELKWFFTFCLIILINSSALLFLVARGLPDEFGNFSKLTKFLIIGDYILLFFAAFVIFFWDRRLSKKEKAEKKLFKK